MTPDETRANALCWCGRRAIECDGKTCEPLDAAPVSRTDELLSAIRAHPHFGAVLGQFEVDAREGLDDEQYAGESKERSELWALCYALLAGKPMPCALCSEPAVPCPNGICGPTYCREHWWRVPGDEEDGGDDE